MSRANLIVLEGIAGVGKTTVANELFDKYGWLHIPEVINHYKAKKFTEDYFIFAEEIKIDKYLHSKANKIIMDRSPISIMAHNFVRKHFKQENSYDLLISWFEKVIKPIKKQKFVYLRTNDCGKCIKRKWGEHLERFPKEFSTIRGMQLWTQKESLHIFQEYYDIFFNNGGYNFKIIDSNHSIGEIVNQIMGFYDE